MRWMAVVLIGLGLLILAMATAGWFLFPAWQQTPGGIDVLLGLTMASVIPLVTSRGRRFSGSVGVPHRLWSLITLDSGTLEKG